MYADGGILRCDARLLRQVAEFAILQIYDPQRLSIFRLESREKAGNALADLLPQHRVGLLNSGELSTPSLHSPCGAGAVTVMIDHGVAQDPIEPGHHPSHPVHRPLAPIRAQTLLAGCLRRQLWTRHAVPGRLEIPGVLQPVVLPPRAIATWPVWIQSSRRKASTSPRGRESWTFPGGARTRCDAGRFVRTDPGNLGC